MKASNPHRPFYLAVALRSQKAPGRYLLKEGDAPAKKEGDDVDDDDEPDEDEAKAAAEAAFQTRFQKELKRRTTGIEKRLRETLKADPDFIAEITGAPAKKGKVDDAALEELRGGIRKAEVEPLKAELEREKGSIGKLTDRVLTAEILAAAIGVGVKDELTMTVGKRAAIIGALDGVFKYDAESGQHFAVDDDGEFVLSRTGKARYQTVDEYFADFAKDKKNASLLKDQRQRGPNMGNPSDTKRGGVVRISREDARLRSKYAAAEAEAKKIGGTVEITD